MTISVSTCDFKPHSAIASCPNITNFTYNSNNNGLCKREERLKITFPKPYFDFLCHIQADDVFEVEGSGIGLFSYSDLEETNETYEVRAYEPNYLMIGQDGDMGYFISTNTPNDYSIYANDLGASGSLPMNKAANDIFELINKFQ